MFGKMPRLNPLESRKQSLVSESELNCAKVVGDMAVPTVGVRSLVSRSISFGSVASSAAVLVAGLAAFRRGTPVPTDAKPSWVQTVLRGTGLISPLWLAYRAKGHDQENE
jgi:hypothetical protein